MREKLALFGGKKILVTGSSGMLGKDIVEILIKNEAFDIYAFDKHYNPRIAKDNQFIVDLTNFEFLTKSLNKINPAVIIHCAAIVNIDACEKDKKSADALHREATRVLSSYNSRNTKFMYISTDSIFDGKKGNYAEEDVPNPLNYYAKSKLEGEKVALSQNPNALVIRTNIYGFHTAKDNSLVEWAIENLKAGRSIDGYEDIIFNAIYTKQLARIIQELIILDNYKGILNVAGNECVSKYDFLIELAKTFNFPAHLINKNSSDEMKFSISRPKNTTLSINKLKYILYQTPYLAAGLRELRKDYKKLIRLPK